MCQAQDSLLILIFELKVKASYYSATGSRFEGVRERSIFRNMAVGIFIGVHGGGVLLFSEGSGLATHLDSAVLCTSVIVIIIIIIVVIVFIESVGTWRSHRSVINSRRFGGGWYTGSGEA